MFDEDKNVIGVIGTSIDITEKKKIEELLVYSDRSLEESLIAKEKFLRNLDHESRNSIQLAHVASNLLMTNWSSLGNNERFELVKEIDHSTTRFCTMINNIFDLSEFITKEANLKLAKHSLTKTVKEYLNIFSKQFNCNVKLEPVSNDFVVVFDKEKIISVLMNLLLNAKRWSPTERIISINLIETLISNYVPAVQCCIKDAGTGIEEDELESVFLPFIQGSKVKNSTGGVGAGLALCNEIIKAHAGEIWAENNLNKGCTFNFIIPMNLPIL
jgi:two-component system sensor histidine kinase ChiS